MKRKAKTATRQGSPTTVNGTLPPPRCTNAQLRPREFLTGEEVERLRKACGERLGRYAHRDSTMILIAYRHGLRVSELVGLRLGHDRPEPRPHARQPPQAGPPVDAHPARQRATSAASPTAQAGAAEPLRLHYRAPDADDRRRLPQAARADRHGGRVPIPCPSAHAASRLRL